MDWYFNARWFLKIHAKCQKTIKNFLWVLWNHLSWFMWFFSQNENFYICAAKIFGSKIPEGIWKVGDILTIYRDISIYPAIYSDISRYIAIYHEMIYRDISYLWYIVKYLHKIIKNFQNISIYFHKWYITIYQNIFIKYNIDISWYIILLDILRYIEYIDIF